MKVRISLIDNDGDRDVERAVEGNIAQVIDDAYPEAHAMLDAVMAMFWLPEQVASQRGADDRR